MTFLSDSSSKTENLGKKLGKKVLKRKKGAVIALLGPLGSGKTTFLKGFAKGLGIKEKILSPTFIIFRKIPITRKRFFYHFDCYRIKNKKELSELGLEDIVKDDKNIVAIEWPEKARSFFPENFISISFRHARGDKRKISFLDKDFHEKIHID